MTPINYRWRGEQYVIMAANGMVTEDEFDAFWDHFINHSIFGKTR